MHNVLLDDQLCYFYTIWEEQKKKNSVQLLGQATIKEDRILFPSFKVTEKE